MTVSTTLRASDTLRLLCISFDEPSWIGITLQLGASGVKEPHYRWANTRQDALKILRREIYDAILLFQCRADENQLLTCDKIQQLLEAMRTSGHDEPAILVTTQLSDDYWAALCDLDCEPIISEYSWNSPALVPAILRAVKRNELIRSNRRMESSCRKQEAREQTESENLLRHLDQMIHDRILFNPHTRLGSTNLPSEIRKVYQHLLRTFCMMGEGSLSSELTQLASVLTMAEVSATEVLKMHLNETHTLVDKLGARGARHVLIRADLLIIELLVHLGDEVIAQVRK